MPSMKELQELLAQLDAEGGLAIGAEDRNDTGNLDDLYEDSYLHAILHNNVKEEQIPAPFSPKEEGDNNVPSSPSSSSSTVVDVLSLPADRFWGDDHEQLGSKLYVRNGFKLLISSLLSSSSSSSSRTWMMATGAKGSGKSCLAHYLAYKLFQAGKDIVISDSMFTNALINKEYSSCYTPHIDRHPTIHAAVTAKSGSSSAAEGDKKSEQLWWICDDGVVPVAGTTCNVFMTSLANKADAVTEELTKQKKLPSPTVFAIPRWSLDEMEAALVTVPGWLDREDLKTYDDAELQAEREQWKQLYLTCKASPKKVLGFARDKFAPELDAPLLSDEVLAQYLGGDGVAVEGGGSARKGGKKKSKTRRRV
ncbi:hypothetical protein DFQ26_002836 [Actinomortierella ambigua]|nr:hypothetical protein DFQ26_002836 [Actinomortierella ambigua]